MTTAESKITDDAIVNTVTSSKTYKDALSGKVDTSTYNTKMEQLDNSISLKATATDVYTKTQADVAFDAKGSAAMAKSEAILSAKSYTDTAITDMATKEYVTNQGYLTATSDVITSKVSKNDVISAINQTAESVSINASKINFNGAVTFSSFDNPLQTAINNKAETIDLEDVRTTANKAQTSINNLEIGGRNLILKSNTPVESTSYLIKEYTLSEDWNADLLNDRGYILTLKGSINNGQKFGVWLNGASNQAGYMTYDSEKDLYYVKPYLPTSTPITEGYKRAIRIYNYPSGTAANANIEWVKLEIGNKATDWTPAPEDVDAGIANAAKVATNFINYDSTNGLILGNKESGSWVGYRTQIDTDSFNVLNENGDIIASYGSNEVELGKGNPSAIIKMCDGKAYVKNYIVGSQNTSVFCGQDVTVVGEWEGASEAYALFKQGFINIGQASSYIKFFNEHDNMNQVVIQGQNIRMVSASTIGNFDCYMKPRFFTMAGEIKMWAGDAIPDGWLLCDGSEVSKTDYPQLYKAIGDLWGVPSNSSNFKLPNLTGRVPVGYNSADTDTTETFGKVGATGGARGAWYHTHTIGSSGAHSHASQGRMEGSGTGANIFESYNGASKTRSVNVPRTGTNGNHTHSPGSSGSEGNKLAADKANMPPYAVVKYIICAI